MSRISADFGDTNITIVTKDREAFDIYAKLNRIFDAAGMGAVEQAIEQEGYGEYVRKGPARNLRADNLGLAAF